MCFKFEILDLDGFAYQLIKSRAVELLTLKLERLFKDI